MVDPRPQGSSLHGAERHGQAGQFADDPRPGGRQGVDARLPEVVLLGSVGAGPSRVFDDHGQVIEAGEAGRGRRQLIGMRHQLEDQAPIRQALEDLGRRQGLIEPAHRADPTEAGSGHLVIDELERFGHAVGRRQTADDGVGAAGGYRVAIERDGLVNRVTTGGGGDVDELLDIPPGGLAPVEVDVEAAVHPQWVTAAPLRRVGQVGVPVRGGVPEVHVGIDDAGGLRGHRSSVSLESPA